MKLIELKEKILRMFEEDRWEELEETEETATYINNIIENNGKINIYNGDITIIKEVEDETKWV